MSFNLLVEDVAEQSFEYIVEENTAQNHLIEHFINTENKNPQKIKSKPQISKWVEEL